MKRPSATTAISHLVLLCAVLSGAAGCNHEVVGQVAALSGAYIGDVVTVAVTGYLNDALGIEGGGAVDEHSHEAEPLHDHEH